jgi:hypothetical protein
MKFFFVLFWEVVENLPMSIGFLIAVRVRRKSLAVALASLMAGTVLSSVLICAIQAYRLSGVPELDHPPPSAALFVNILTFTGMGSLVMLYCSAEAWWSNWKTDIVLGLLSGLLIALAQASLSWSVDVFHIPLHLIASAMSGPVFLLGVRRLRGVRSWPLALAGIAVCAVIASAIVVAIDYRPF